MNNVIHCSETDIGDRLTTKIDYVYKLIINDLFKLCYIPFMSNHIIQRLKIVSASIK